MSKSEKNKVFEFEGVFKRKKDEGDIFYIEEIDGDVDIFSPVSEIERIKLYFVLESEESPYATSLDEARDRREGKLNSWVLTLKEPSKTYYSRLRKQLTILSEWKLEESTD